MKIFKILLSLIIVFVITSFLSAPTTTKAISGWILFSQAQESQIQPAVLPMEEAPASAPPVGNTVPEQLAPPTEVGAPAPPSQPAPPVPTGAPEAISAPSGGQPETPPSPPSAAPVLLEAQKAIDADINLTAQDLGVSESRILPDSTLYPVKEAWREVKFFFTFGSANKAQKRLEYTNEKLIEVKKIAEKTDEPKVIEKALENYKEELREIKNEVKDIKKQAKDDAKVDKFLEKFVDANLKQQKLMDKIQNEAPAAVFKKISETKEETLNQFAEVSLKIAEPEEFEEKITKVIKEQKGSDFKNFKNLEILKQVEEKVPEVAKEAIQKARQNTLERLKKSLENIPEAKQETFRDYVKDMPGQELKQMEIIHEFENEKIAPALREIMTETKKLAIEKVERLIRPGADSDLSAKEKQQMILRDLEGHKMQDLRIIKELENNLPPESVAKILGIKNKTLDNIRIQMEGADTEEKQEKFFKEVKKFHDVKQFEMFKEMEKVVPPEKKEFFEKMKDKAMDEMKKDVERAGDEMKKKMVFQHLASDNPEAMSIIKEFGPPPEIMQDIMKEQVRKLEQKIENEQDAQKLQLLKQRMAEDETVRQELTTKNPEIFKKIDARETILNQGMNAATAQSQIEKVKQELLSAQNDLSGADQTMAQMTPASRLLELGQKHISEAESALSQEQIGRAFGQATAALHEVNSVRKIVKEVSLRKEIGQKREEELKQKYQEMMPEIQPMSGGEQNQIPGQSFENSDNKPTTTDSPMNIGNIDMMKCPMPQKIEGCAGRIIMEKNEQGCPQFSCQPSNEFMSTPEKEQEMKKIREPLPEKTMPGRENPKEKLENLREKFELKRVEQEIMKEKEPMAPPPTVIKEKPMELKPESSMMPQTIIPEAPQPPQPQTEPAVPTMTQPPQPSPSPLNEPGSVFEAIKKLFR